MAWFCFPVAVKHSGTLARNLHRPFHHTGGAKGHHFVWKKRAAHGAITKAKAATVLVCIFVPGALAGIPYIPPSWIPDISNPGNRTTSPGYYIPGRGMAETSDIHPRDYTGHGKINIQGDGGLTNPILDNKRTITPVPEPPGIWLLLTAIASILLIKRKSIYANTLKRI